MAALRALMLIVATMAALSHAADATMYTVGAPNGGWDMSTDLQTWASAVNFTVGDSLVFRYASNHDVVEVVKTEYDACTATKPIQSFKGGNTVVFLPVAGKKYFICSVSGHCAAGMKLEVDVTSASWMSTPQSPLSSPAPAPMAPSPEQHTAPAPMAPSPDQHTAPAPMAPSPEQHTAPPPMMHEGAPAPSVGTPMAAPPSDAPSTSNSPMSSPPSIAQTLAPTPQLASAAPASDFGTAAAPTPKSSGARGCRGAHAKSKIGFIVGLLFVMVM